MRPHSGHGILALGLALLATTVGGCQATHQQSRRQAVQRWNAVRAQVKAKLAADQLSVGNVVDAADALADACRLDPNLAELAPLQGRVHLAQGDTYNAQRFLEDARSKPESTAEVDYLLGIVHQHRQRWDDALACFLQANHQAPDDVSYFTAVVQAMLQLGQTDAALEWLHSGRERFGWTGAYQAAAAEVHEQLGDWNAAATAWSKVVGNADVDAGLRERLATALYRAGRLEEALPLLAQLCAQPRTSEDEAAYVPSDTLKLALADCWLEEGRSDAAREQIAAVLRRQEHNSAAWRLLARVLAAQRQYERALAAARRAVEMDGSDRAALELAAGLACRMGRDQLAATLAAQLLERDPTYENPVARLILARGGRTVRARVELAEE